MSRINLYAQNNHAMVINGVTLAGFAEGDWLQVKLDGNAAMRKHAADGPIVNFNKSQGGTITVSLVPTSPALGYLIAMRHRQAVSISSATSNNNETITTAKGRVVPVAAKQVKNNKLFSISLITGVNEVISAQGCGFAELPEFSSGGATMQPRQFVFECLVITLDESNVTPIKGGMLGGLIPFNF